MLPTTGSRSTAAIWSPRDRKRSASDSGSLYSSTTVSRAVPAVTPGESGTPSVAADDPADTSRLSAWPW